MKFNDYMVKKSSPLNESSSYTKINEAGTEDFGAIIKGIMAYSKASGMMANYEKAAQEADTNFTKAKTLQKTAPMINKALITREKAKGMDKEMKKKMIIQADAMEGQVDKIKDSEATILQQKADEYTNIKSELDSELSSIAPESLKSIITKQKTLADQKAKIRGLKAMEGALSMTKDKARAEKLKAEMQAAEDDFKSAMANLEDAEDAGSEDLQEVEGVKAVEPELKAFMAAGAKFKSEKTKLQAVYDSAASLAEGEDYDYSRSAEEIHELFLAELGMNEDELYEEEEGAVTPTTVLSKINACKEEVRPELYKQLKAVLPTWKTAKVAQIAAKKAIWEKVKGKPSTKSVLLVAGATDETIEEGTDDEGKTVYTASEPGKKWKAAFEDPESEGGPLAGVKAVEDKLAEIEEEPTSDEAPTKEEPTKEEPTSDEAPTKEEPTSDEAPAKKEPTSDEAPAKKEPTSDEAPAKEEPTSDEAPAKEEPEEEVDKPKKESESAESAPKKIMKFEDFMSSRSNG